jgi:hypothetical protein
MGSFLSSFKGDTSNERQQPGSAAPPHELRNREELLL